MVRLFDTVNENANPTHSICQHLGEVDALQHLLDQKIMTANKNISAIPNTFNAMGKDLSTLLKKLNQTVMSKTGMDLTNMDVDNTTPAPTVSSQIKALEETMAQQ